MPRCALSLTWLSATVVGSERGGCRLGTQARPFFQSGPFDITENKPLRISARFLSLFPEGGESHLIPGTNC